MDINIYLVLLKALLNHQTYGMYYSYINLEFLEKNYPDVYRLYTCLPHLHEPEPPESDVVFGLEDLRLLYTVSYPSGDTSGINQLLEAMGRLEAQDSSVASLLASIREREIALRVAKQALKVADGSAGVDSLAKEYERLAENPASDEGNWRANFVTNNIVEIITSNKSNPGLRWRLKSLNRALGALRQGNFGFVFARPETGKTTFLTSEVSFMAEQTDRPIIWFNNEEAGKAVQKRMHMGALGITNAQLEDDPEKWQAEYMKLHGGFILNDAADETKQSIENICRHLNPALIIFDQIDKIHGFQADRNDLELKAIYQWARELAKKYGPVIGVCQAGGSGEDKKWLTMNDVDNSKTGKQGEADFILGIGKIHEPGMEYLRYLHLSKNKLPGDTDGDPQMRHGKWQVLITPEIARYKDIGE